MFSSPLTHYFRHVFLTYTARAAGLQKRLLINKELSILEAACVKLLEKYPEHADGPRLTSLLGRIRRMKAAL